MTAADCASTLQPSREGRAIGPRRPTARYRCEAGTGRRYAGRVTPEQLSTAIVDVLTTLSAEGAITLPDGVPTTVTVERPAAEGARRLRHQRRAAAGQEGRDEPARRSPSSCRRGLEAGRRRSPAVEIAGPGFLNITVAAGAQGVVAAQIVDAGAAYGGSDAFAGEKINLEFVSANPTGPIHIGGVRWAAVGDALGRIFEMTGARGHPRVLLQRPRRPDRPVQPLAAGQRQGRAGARGRVRRRVHPRDRRGGRRQGARRSRTSPTTRRRRSSAPRASR